MTQRNRIRHIADRAAQYWICVYGHVAPDLCEQLGGMKATAVDGGSGMPMTVLSGQLPDQAALAGVLTCLHDYGLALISLERCEAELSQRG